MFLAVARAIINGGKLRGKYAGRGAPFPLGQSQTATHPFGDIAVSATAALPRRRRRLGLGAPNKIAEFRRAWLKGWSNKVLCAERRRDRQVAFEGLVGPSFSGRVVVPRD